MFFRPGFYRPKFLAWGTAVLALFMATASPAADTTQLPPSVKTLQAEGLNIVGEFKTDDGLRAFAAAAGDRPVAIYVTKDGNAIVGTRVDPQGNPMDQATLQNMVAKPMAKKALSQLEQATWVRDGKKDAPRVIYTFSDPNCPYCHKFWEAARPWVDAGTVQLRHLVVAVIRPDSAAKAAAILGAKDPTVALIQNEHAFSNGGIKPASSVSPAIRTTLNNNEQLMMNLGFRGTPGIVAMGSDGLLEKINGLPQQGALVKLMGSPAPTAASKK